MEKSDSVGQAMDFQSLVRTSLSPVHQEAQLTGRTGDANIEVVVSISIHCRDLNFLPCHVCFIFVTYFVQKIRPELSPAPAKLTTYGNAGERYFL